MSRLHRAWDDFFFAPSSGHRIAAVRVLLGVYLLFYFGAQLPHAALLFSNEGVYSPYLVPDYAPDPWAAQLLLAATLGAALALTVGLHARVAAGLLLISLLYHYFLSNGVKQSAFDRLLAMDLLVLCLASSGAVFGLDARARREPVDDVTWPERMLAIQTALLYLGPGLWKLFTPAWRTGVLLESNLQSMFASKLAFAIVQLDLARETWAFMSWSIIAFELLMLPLLVMRRTRPLALALGVAFHLANCTVLVIPEFLISLVAYPVFLKESTLASLARRLTSAMPAPLAARLSPKPLPAAGAITPGADSGA